MTIISAIINLLFMGKGYDEAVPIFLKSIVFIIISTIIICNKKEIKKFIGTLFSINTLAISNITSEMFFIRNIFRCTFFFLFEEL